MRVSRAPWTSASFLIYFGGLLALIASAGWLGVISANNGDGAFAGWSVVFWAVAEAIAIALLVKGRRVAAGMVGFVGLGLFAVMVGAFWDWFGWLSDQQSPFTGFHFGDLVFYVIVLVAAFVGLQVFRFPLFVLPVAFVAFVFVTDLVSNGGNWTTTVILLFGFLYFLIGLGIDGSDSRPYGFWVHFLAGALVMGAFLQWWHTSDAQWAGIIVVSLIFILTGAGIRRSSYTVIGSIGLVLATAHYTGGEVFGQALGGQAPTDWAIPVGYLCLGAFLALIGTSFYRNRDADPA